MPDEVRYSNAQIMFGDVEIICGGFKSGYKRETEEYTALNNDDPYATRYGSVSVEPEASDVDPALRPVLQKMFDEKTEATLASYDYDNDTGSLFEDDVFYNAYIKELSKEDVNKPFTVKWGCRGYKKQ